MKFTTEDFVIKSKDAHGDKYDYSLVNYINKRSKVNIICPIHGEFEQIAYYHYYFKQGCQKCKVNKQLTTEEFIERAKLIHEDKYDYSLVNYINAYTKVDIICKKHGIFSIRPADHINNKKINCSMCSLGYKKNNKITTEEFIKHANDVHHYKYNYSKTNYKNSKCKITIICEKHGEFEQNASSHISGKGCPNCNTSLGENKIENYLKNNNIAIEKQKKFELCKNINYLPFDFYLTDFNICIEYDGIQHFEVIEYFGGENSLKENKIRDNIKNEYCKNNNIHLIRISYKEKIEEKLNHELANFLNNSDLF